MKKRWILGILCILCAVGFAMGSAEETAPKAQNIRADRAVEL